MTDENIERCEPVKDDRIALEYTKDTLESAVFDNMELATVNNRVRSGNALLDDVKDDIRNLMSEIGALVPLTLYDDKGELVTGMTGLDTNDSTEVRKGFVVSFGPLLRYDSLNADALPVFTSWSALHESVNTGRYKMTDAMPIKGSVIRSLLEDGQKFVIDPFTTIGGNGKQSQWSGDMVYDRSVLTGR